MLNRRERGRYTSATSVNDKRSPRPRNRSTSDGSKGCSNSWASLDQVARSSSINGEYVCCGSTGGEPTKLMGSVTGLTGVSGASGLPCRGFSASLMWKFTSSLWLMRPVGRQILCTSLATGWVKHILNQGDGWRAHSSRPQNQREIADISRHS